jgi:glutamyl-tRNA reductase
MRLVAVGLSHHTAPVEVRERFAVAPASVPGLLQRFRDDKLGQEAFLVSTCNRVELYAVPGKGRHAADVAGWLANINGLRSRSVGEFLYQYDDEAALRHLFRVASSLDSMIVGEPQIMHQLKDAWRIAQDSGDAGPSLRRVIDRAFSVAKRARTETAIAREGVSMGRAGVELARQVLGSFQRRSALLIGAGAHGKLVARSLLGYGLSELTIANRTFSRAMDMAQVFGATATHLDEVPNHLPRVDVVITSTGAGRLLIRRQELQAIMRRRRFRSLVMIDLSVPRNIDPAVNDLDGVYRFDVDDLREMADQGLERRKVAAAEAERIVAEESAEAWRQIRAEVWRGEIGRVVRRAESIRQAELARAGSALEGLDPKQRRAVDAMTRAMMKKVLHPGLRSARQLAESGDTDDLERLLAALGADRSESS